MADERQDTAAAAGGGEDALAEAHEALLADPSLQFQFHDFEQPEPPEWLGPFGEFLRFIGPFLEWVFWLGLAAIALALLYVIVREIMHRWPAKRAAVAEEAAPVMDFRPTKERARALLEEADRLAREGRYSEAARVLLHRSIEDIENTFPIVIGPAMTSREIGRIERLSERARSVFVRIAQAVETSLFGGRDLDATQYQECRAIYETFAFGSGR